MIIPTLLCGGVGSRLWPLSRQSYPKQFLRLSGQLTMLQETLRRGEQVSMASQPLIVCNEEHRFLVAQQLHELKVKPQAIVLEPEGKNTAPAVAAAAFKAMDVDADAVLLILPADHVLKNLDAFSQAVSVAVQAAEQGRVVTFGIAPDSPETGYGYIKGGELLQDGCFTIDAFVEKPDLPTAQKYLADGCYYWNSGMFLVTAKSYLEELKTHAPDIFDAVKKSYLNAKEDMDFLRLDKGMFASSPSDSIDYAVMEKTTHGAVVPLDSDWSDVGSWSMLWTLGEKDAGGNVLVGDVMTRNCEDNYIRSESRLVAALGVSSLVVVETADAVLVADKHSVQDVKAIVQSLQSAGRSEAQEHTRVYRPWGSYESIAMAERFQVKRIIVNPGQRLSLQMHHHRAEHWIVVSGTAKVTCGETVSVLTEDQSTYIPLGTKHRLENPGVIPLELIEVQTGSYLGEDDIVRFDDVYGRSQT